MKLLRSTRAFDFAGGCALTIGNFDAVHLGHRKILAKLIGEAKQRDLPAVVMTFDPHPREYFGAPDGTRLTTTATRFFALREAGVDVMLSLRFNDALARTTADDFIRRHLKDALNTKYLLVGDDFRFGAKRAGDFALLKKHSAGCGYEVARFDTIAQHDRRISSSWIRELLAAGDLAAAEVLLGRKYAHAGRVIHGDQRGRALGFPTINLAVRHRPALTGVFAVTVTGVTDRTVAGVASLGWRPTVTAAKKNVVADGAKKNLLEVFLFDYAGDAYGKRVCVEFVKKIRDEEKFADLNALKKQMTDDARIARSILGVN